MLNLFYYDFGARLIKPDPNIYYRTKKSNKMSGGRGKSCGHNFLPDVEKIEYFTCKKQTLPPDLNF